MGLPPLRDRGDDLLLLADHFLKAFSEEEGKGFRDFDADALAVLQGYDWPGNVRQLQNVVRNIVVLNEGDKVTASMLPPPLEIKSTPSTERSVPESETSTVAGISEIKP